MNLFEHYISKKEPTSVNQAMKGLYRVSRPLTEADAAVGMIAWGRGYGEEPVSDEPSAMDIMNMSTMMNDPFTGGRNIVLSRVNEFDLKNAGRYTEDTEPELDDYTQTCFIEDMGPEAYTVNGENPYRAMERIRQGDPDVVVPKPVQEEQPEISADPEADQAARDMFAQMFETIPSIK